MTRYYAYQLQPNGRRGQPIKPGGQQYFGALTLKYVENRAKHKRQRILVGTEHPKVPAHVVAAHPALDPRRLRVIAWDMWAVDNRDSIGYQETRPIPYAAMVAHRPFNSDCSGTAHGGAKVAGFSDPSGFNFNGYGNTQSMMDHAKAHGLIIPIRLALPGDYCVFAGPMARQHVVRFHQPGSLANPTVFSHGQPSGPWLLPLSDERGAHAGQELVCIRAA